MSEGGVEEGLGGGAKIIWCKQERLGMMLVQRMTFCKESQNKTTHLTTVVIQIRRGRKLKTPELTLSVESPSTNHLVNLWKIWCALYVCFQTRSTVC